MKNFLKFFALLLVLSIFIPSINYYFFKILFCYLIVVFAKKIYTWYQTPSEVSSSHSKKDETIKTKNYRLSEKEFNLLLIYNKLLTPDKNWRENLDNEIKELKRNDLYSGMTSQSYFHYQDSFYPCNLVLALPENETSFENYLANSNGKLNTHYYVKYEDEILTRLPLDASEKLYEASNKKREISAKLNILGGPYSKYMDTFDKSSHQIYWDVKEFDENPFLISIHTSLFDEDEKLQNHFRFYNQKITSSMLREAYRTDLNTKTLNAIKKEKP